MAYFFGDSFDLYTYNGDYLPASPTPAYWDGGTIANITTYPQAGRFPNSQSASFSGAVALFKNSGSNDAVHHINLSVFHIPSFTGTTNYCGFILGDGATAQCSVCFRSDGSLVLMSGSYGTVLATWQALTAINIWASFEIEVVIHNTAGSITVRKNGNPVNDFQATGLNTRAGTTNNYANRISLGAGASGANTNQNIDDFLWRSDAASVPWIGDVRCCVRRPFGDTSIQFSPSTSAVPVQIPSTVTRSSVAYGSQQARYVMFYAPCSGTIGSVSINITNNPPTNMKCAIYSSVNSKPQAVLGTSNNVASPALGQVTFTFASPPSVTVGLFYFVAFCSDAAPTVTSTSSAPTPPPSLYVLYAQNSAWPTFPATAPTVAAANFADDYIVNITPTGATNYGYVAELDIDNQQSYVYSPTVGANDLYGLSTIPATPTQVFGVTTRAYALKTDGGARSMAVQLRSGSTTVQGAAGSLNTLWGWFWRTDTVDPATGAAWTDTACANAKVGMIITA